MLYTLHILHMHTYTSIYIYTYVHTFVHIYIYIYIHTYKRIHIHTIHNIHIIRTIHNMHIIHIKYISDVQVWNDDFFPKKKHVKFGRMIKRNLNTFSKYAPLLVTHFSYLSGNLWIHSSKNLPLLPRTIHRAIFSHLRTNQSAAQQVRDPSMQTSDNRKEPRWVSRMG